jgi:hypothetical protein
MKDPRNNRKRNGNKVWYGVTRAWNDEDGPEFKVALENIKDDFVLTSDADFIDKVIHALATHRGMRAAFKAYLNGAECAVEVLTAEA